MMCGEYSEHVCILVFFFSPGALLINSLVLFLDIGYRLTCSVGMKYVHLYLLLLIQRPL